MTEIKEVKRKEIVASIKGLCKRYSKKSDYAIEDISFVVRAGEITGLIGHNGAGKSTTLKCLEGMLPFEKGSISICGYDIKTQPTKAKMNMGFVTDNHAVFVKMTGYEYLSFMADVYKVESSKREERIKELDKVFGLGEALGNLITSYSHGMRQKICMMGSLIHKPKLWILDEPMTGLDPVAIKSVQDYMQHYVQEGNSILFSSHALEYLAKICDKIVLIKKGRQSDIINVRETFKRNPNFNFEEYFFKSIKG